MEQYFRKIVAVGLEEGHLEIIPLIGLGSPFIPQIIQKYIDNTGDIQTAAYVASYALCFTNLIKS